jgi:hypothetical protein
MDDELKETQIINTLVVKSCMKQHVFDNTFDIFKKLKLVLQELVKEYNKKLKKQDDRLLLSYKEEGLFQCELKIAGDILVFQMHSNIFEFDRDHGVWKISYVQKDKSVTYSGIINIYNFLSDSFKYNRIDDLGYLIARIFINKELHYFVEGKQQMGFFYNDFGKNIIDEKVLKDFVESAILYSLKFDLLVPPYDNVKILSVAQIQENRKQRFQTGKRLGYSFNSDDVNGTKLQYTGG